VECRALTRKHPGYLLEVEAWALAGDGPARTC
jgi:hypothetical protein